MLSKPTRAAPSTRRLLLAVYAPTFLLSLGQGVIVPTLPLYALTFQDSFSLISLVVAAAGLGTLVADVPVGMMMERVGRKPLMMIGTGMVAVFSLMLALATSYPELIVYRLAVGIGTAMWNISRMAYITEMLPPSERGKALSTFGGVMRIGLFGGPALGGVVASTFGLSSSFFLTAAFGFVALAVSAVFVVDTGRLGPLKGHMRWQAVGGVVRRQFRDFATAGSAQIFAQMIRAGRQIIVPLFGASVLGLDVAAVGAIISISAAVDMSLFIPAGLIMDRFGRKFASVPCFLILGVGMAMIPFATDYSSLLVATCVMSIGNGIGSGTMMTLGADLAPKEATGEFLGVWRLIGDVGSTGGPIVVGAVADVFGLAVSAAALAGIGFLAGGLLAVFVRETLQTPEPAPSAQRPAT